MAEPGRLKVFEPIGRLQPDGFLYRSWEGHAYPPFIDPEASRRLLEEWDTDAHDVFICTHQKVGTHLMKKFTVEVLRALYAFPEGHPMAQGDIGHGAVPWPEVMVSQYGMGHFREFLSLTAGSYRVWYLHSPADMLPMRSVHPKAKFVCVFRDPRAVAVSQYFFYKSHPLLGVPQDLTMGRFVDLFLEGGLYFGDYHRHTLDWVGGCKGRIARENLLVLRYEELVERKDDVVDVLSAHLGGGDVLSDAQEDRIADSTEFDTMRKGIEQNPGSFHFNPKTFFRAGTTDDWRNHLDAEMERRINGKSEEIWGEGNILSPDLSGCKTLDRP